MKAEDRIEALEQRIQALERQTALLLELACDIAEFCKGLRETVIEDECSVSDTP